ncbi:hypothetical protein MLD38_027306 [Melastoma candidum]|uniref:Uncharacterized protein n=1 Tax=Melastoma candidum TaxID=119954 RepID=A0ACB9P370_9MYRT|nr:hypothetical protein MLD38_027306 [Melastoma candidum]
MVADEGDTDFFICTDLQIGNTSPSLHSAEPECWAYVMCPPSVEGVLIFFYSFKRRFKERTLKLHSSVEIQQKGHDE